jgi:hypothetical protein
MYEAPDSIAIARSLSGSHDRSLALQFRGGSTHRLSAVDRWSSREWQVFDLREIPERAVNGEWTVQNDSGSLERIRVEQSRMLGSALPEDGVTWTPALGLRFSVSPEELRWDDIEVEFCVTLQGSRDWVCRYALHRHDTGVSVTNGLVEVDILKLDPHYAIPEWFRIQDVPSIYRALPDGLGKRGVYIVWRASLAEHGLGIVGRTPWRGILFDAIRSK